MAELNHQSPSFSLQVTMAVHIRKICRLFLAMRLEVWMKIMQPTRDAKFNPGDLDGPKDQARHVSFQEPKLRVPGLCRAREKQSHCIMQLADLRGVLER